MMLESVTQGLPIFTRLSGSSPILVTSAVLRHTLLWRRSFRRPLKCPRNGKRSVSVSDLWWDIADWEADTLERKGTSKFLRHRPGHTVAPRRGGLYVRSSGRFPEIAPGSSGSSGPIGPVTLVTGRSCDGDTGCRCRACVCSERNRRGSGLDMEATSRWCGGGPAVKRRQRGPV